MKRQIDAIRYLASRELQDRFIVNGSQDEYLLPGELVNDALRFAEDVEAGRLGRSLGQSQREAFAKFAAVLRANAHTVCDSKANAELIGSDVAWASMRAAAQRLMAILESLD